MPSHTTPLSTPYKPYEEYTPIYIPINLPSNISQFKPLWLACNWQWHIMSLYLVTLFRASLAELPWAHHQQVITPLFFAIHEGRILPNHPNVILYTCYLDDICSIWLPSPDVAIDHADWTCFKTDMHNYHGIKWEFKSLGTKVVFIDIMIHFNNGTITTTLFEKSLNMYLYIYPHSCNTPGVLAGLILGTCYMI